MVKGSVNCQELHLGMGEQTLRTCREVRKPGTHTDHQIRFCGQRISTAIPGNSYATEIVGTVACHGTFSGLCLTEWDGELLRKRT
ncbi:hypothetical protein D3C76_1651460 [compost metagenome]